MKKPSLLFLAVCALTQTAVAQQPAPPPRQWVPKVINGGLPSVSPDDKYIAFNALRDTAKPPQIYIIRPDGTGERHVSVDGGGGAPLWTSGGSTVLYEGRAGLVSIDVAGSKATTLRTPEGRGFVPSPDGKWFVYSNGRPPSIPLMISAIDGSSPRALTTQTGLAFNGVWSPDGKRIVYARMDSTRDMQIWIVNADGSGMRQVTRFTGSDGRPQWPSWSPDGKSVAVQAGFEGSAHIWLVDVATGTAKKLAAHDQKYLDETPSFFHDGKRIAFQSDRTGRMEIWVMNVDGTGARQVTR